MDLPLFLGLIFLLFSGNSQEMRGLCVQDSDLHISYGSSETIYQINRLDLRFSSCPEENVTTLVLGNATNLTETILNSTTNQTEQEAKNGTT